MRLAERLRARIAAAGPMTVADWMAACLGDPACGYYRTRDPLGRDGDFVTAPEISQMFGELIGLWAGVVWRQMGAPAPLHLVELGPGRGTLMADALRALAGVDGFLDAVRVHLVETSPVLTERQRQTLAAAPGRPRWHETPATVPDGPAIWIGNEFLDALPVRQLLRTGGRWHERAVAWDGARFRFVAGAEADPALLPAALWDAPDGSVFEVSTAVADIVADLARRLATAGGAALLIDYGHTERALGETLQAVRGHAFADPLADPGNADLTAHVDFAWVSGNAEAAGARVWGPVAQGTFLERLGLAARAATLLAGADAAQAADIARARQRLAGAGEDAMGRVFKAVALAAPALPAPPGFEAVAWA